MAKFKNLSGKQFGKLTVTDKYYKHYKPSGHSVTMWVCKCECGNLTDVSTSALTNGKVISCGCWRKDRFDKMQKEKICDLTNQKFGKLTAINITSMSKRGAIWHCKCDCGNECDVLSVSLKSGNTQSCGCSRKDSPNKISETMRHQNTYYFDNDCGIGELSDGTFFKFDKEDYDLIKNYYWSIKKKSGYVYTKYHQEEYFLHRIITNCPDDKKVDHKNHDTRDNRKINLRVCTQQQNSFNMIVKNKTGYKGVSKNYNHYKAVIHNNGVTYNLGTFLTPEEAAMAYNEKAKELFGEFAYLNNIPCQEQGATQDVVT